MAYFVMDCDGVPPVMPIRSGPEPEIKGSWMLGSKVDRAVPRPLIYTLDSDYEGSPKAMYQGKSKPVMRDDLVAALEGAGVDNIQYFDAILRDPGSGNAFNNFKAFNIVGLVRCADMDKSERMGTSTSDIGDVDFHALVIDETKTGGLLLFRLAEAINAIVVHERVKRAVEKAGVPGMVFYGPGEWSG